MAKKTGILLYLLRICFLLIPAVALLHTSVHAQDSTKAAWLRKQQPDSRKDSAGLIFTKDSAAVKKDSAAPVVTAPIHSPRKAAFYSMVLPGLGQIYNREYWKLPLVYAALGITTGTFIFNMDKYRTYRNAYRIVMDGNEDTKVPDNLSDYSPNQLKYIRDSYREYVDYSVLVFVLAYGLNIVDATVFAHLRNFDMSDDLSMKITPAVINNNSIGFSLKINLGGGKKKAVSNGLAMGNNHW